MPHLEGVRVCSSPVPVKDPFSATVKSTNYLLNALALQNAERAGYDQVHLVCRARLCGLHGADGGLHAAAQGHRRAQTGRAAQGIFVTEDDYVLEGPNMNLGIITQDNEFIVRPWGASAPVCCAAGLGMRLPWLRGGNMLAGRLARHAQHCLPSACLPWLPGGNSLAGLQVPPFDQTLAGVTMTRLLELLPLVRGPDSATPGLHGPAVE